MCQAEIVVVDFMESWIEVENGRWNSFSSWMRKSQWKTKGEKWIEYEYMFFFNCWIFVLLYLLWYSCF
jgi:hypothetical protein